MTPRLPAARRLVIASVVMALLVACTSEENSTTGPTLTSTTSTATTSTSTTSTTTTTVAATTTLPESTTSTLPSGPADAVVPLLVGGPDSAGWLFLGAWQQDGWQASTDPAGNPIRPGIEAGTTLTVRNLDGETEATAGSSAEACFDDRVGPTVDVEVGAPQPPGFGYGAVAVPTQPWPLEPRPVAVAATAPDAYRALGEADVADEPVDATQGAIEQVVVADLDGDGDDEALAVFEFVQPSIGPGAPGDFAALLVVDATTRAAETVLLSSIGPASGDDGSFEVLERARVLDVADLNGDGRMEVLVHVWYYEGASVVVYTYDGTQLTQVLADGCGA